MKKKSLVAFMLTAAMSAGLMSYPATAAYEVPAFTPKTVNPSVKFYVALNGSDENDGSFESPLATIEGARDKVREYKEENGLPEGGIRVYFRAGNYRIEDTFQFEEQDSGTAESPIIYTAYKDEKAMWNGGYYVNGSEFTPVTDKAVLDVLPEESRNKVVQLDLTDFVDINGNECSLTDEEIGTIPSSCGTGKNAAFDENGQVTEGFKMRGMDVYIDDQYMDLARYPNKNFEDSNLGWVHVGQVIKSVPSWEWATGQKPVFVCNDTRFKNWSSFDDIHIKGYLNWDYYHDDVGVENIDTDTKQITLADNTNSGQVEGKRFYFYNILDELDVPGEMYIDRGSGVLYMYPTTDMSKATVKLATFDKQFMIRCNDLSNVVFDSLTFELTRGSIFNIVGGSNVTIQCSSIKNIGQKGVLIGAYQPAEGDLLSVPDANAWLEQKMAEDYDNEGNGVNHTVYGCEMYNLGYGGVKMTGGNLFKLESANFTVENNRIHNWGLVSSGYDNAINYYGYGFRIAHNEMYDAPNGALQGGAMGTVIEYNEIYNVVREIEDASACYTNYLMPAHDITFRYNYIHDIPWAYKTTDDQQYVYDENGKKVVYGHASWDGGVSMRTAIYTDTDLFRPTVYGNIIDNCPMGYYNSGKGEIVENNIFIDTERATGHMIDTAYLTGWPGKEALTIANNNTFRYYFFWPYNSDLWKEAYPEFYEWLGEWESQDDSSDWMGQIRNNLMLFREYPEYLATNLPEHRLRFTDGMKYTYEDNIITTEDPGFVDINNKNYDLKENAAIFDTNPNFERIPVEKIGLINGMPGAEMNNSVALKVGSPKALVKDKVVSVDSSDSNVAPIISDDRTLVPVRFISESLGADVDWNSDTQAVTVTKGEKKIEMTIGKNEITVNGTAQAMDVPAQIINGRTMIPLRALAEVGLDKEVFWDASGLIIIGNDAHLLNRTGTDNRTLARVEERLSK